MYRKALLASTLATLLLILSLTTACSQNSSVSTTEDSPVEVTVFAAASLNAAGAELERAYEEEHQQVDLSFNYAGSSKLVQQIEQGAGADLLITADKSSMQQAQEKLTELAQTQPQVIASNQLVLASAPDNPAGISSLQDLSSAEVTTGICALEVPCGTLAHRVLDQEKISLGSASEEANVSEVASKVASGTVDAGFIYSTDLAVLEKTHTITHLDLPNLPANSYPAALTSQGAESEQAKEFFNWLSTDQAQKILQDYGFGPAQDS